jgi:Amidohydrolase family
VGFATRETKDAGIQGPEEAIDLETALELYTNAGAKLFGEATRLGALAPGMRADLVAYSQDPLDTPIDRLPDLKPRLTLVGGRRVTTPAGYCETQARTSEPTGIRIIAPGPSCRERRQQRAIDGLPFLLATEPGLDIAAYAREVVTAFDLATRVAR